ncbi:MAG TPA: hypothetical protein VEO92_06970, partial [Candidatus Nitrosocosmicus sp.]|nr:hypothetical protein [Candidatus Nitrosocosmicus sp.]
MDVEDSTRRNLSREAATTLHPELQKSTLIHSPGFLVLLPGLITVIGWEILAWRWPIVAKLVSRPSDVPRGIVHVVWTGEIWQHLEATLTEMAVGYLIGALSGVSLGFLFGRVKLLGEIFNPYISLFNGIPKVALAPVFVIWFGIGLMSKIA